MMDTSMRRGPVDFFSGTTDLGWVLDAFGLRFGRV